MMKRNDDGTYEIMYDDGDKESGVAADFVKAPEETRPKPANAAASDRGGRAGAGASRRHEGVREG